MHSRLLRCSRRSLLRAFVLGSFSAGWHSGAAEPKSMQEAESEPSRLPSRFIVNYPPAERFCPPIATAFYDADHNEQVVNGKFFRAHPNGGFGVAMMERNGVPLLHTGADLGWHRAGASVFAVADGVVRISTPGLKRLNAELKLKLPIPNGPVDYGNLIVIEHRTPAGSYFLSLYGHLANERLVRAGDVVTAGQVIGSIGREAGSINGGYKPHLHFAIHEGQYLEPGSILFHLRSDDGEIAARLVELGEKEVRVALSRTIPDGEFRLRSGDRVTWRRDGDHYVFSSKMLWTVNGPTRARLAGYQPTIEGFLDPIRFLREAGAETAPAPIFKATWLGPLNQPAVVGLPAPVFEAEEWLQPVSDPPTQKSLQGRVVCFVFFQLNCPGSITHGLPALRELERNYADNERVQVIGVNLATRDFRRNSPSSAWKRIQAFDLNCPIAHIGTAKRPPQVEGFGVRATPWVVLVGGDGTIEFSNAVIRPTSLSERIDELLGSDE